MNPVASIRAEERPRGETRPPGRWFSGLGICLALAGALLVLSLLGRMQLTARQEEINECTSEIKLLEEENAKLRIAYSGMIDLEAIEKEAVEVLGMGRPRPGQPAREKESLRDSMTVLAPEGAGAVRGFWENCVGRLGECFP